MTATSLNSAIVFLTATFRSDPSSVKLDVYIMCFAFSVTMASLTTFHPDYLILTAQIAILLQVVLHHLTGCWKSEGCWLQLVCCTYQLVVSFYFIYTRIQELEFRN